MNHKCLATLLAVSISSLATSHAANLYWDFNGTSTWNSAANWDNATDGTGGDPLAAPGASDTAFFNITTLNASITANLTANTAVGGLVFRNTGTTGIRTDGTGNYRVTLGNGGITINSGAGAVTFGTTTNLFRIPLTLADNQTWTNNSTSTFTLNNQNPIANGGFTLTIDGSGNITQGTAAISGTGGLVKNGTGNVTFAAPNSYSGTTKINAGRITLTNNLALQNSPLDTSGAGVLRLTTGNTTSNLGGLSGGNDLASVITSGYASVTALTLNPGAGVTADYSGNLTNGAANMTLTKNGAGTQILSGNNTYTGNTTVSTGTLVVAQPSALPGYNSANMTVFNNGTIAVRVGGSGWTTTDVDTLLSNATKGGGALGIDTTNGNLTQWTAFPMSNLGTLGLAKHGNNTLTLDQANTFNGTFTVVGGTLSLTNVNALQNAILDTGTPGSQQVTFDVAGTNTYNIAGLGGTDELALDANTTISVGASNVDSTFNGALSGTGNLTKTGSATTTLILTGNSTSYNGVITVSGGVLQLTTTPKTLGSTAGNTVVQSGAQVRTNVQNNFFEENFTLSGIGTGTSGAGNGALGMQINSGNITHNGTITLNGGATLGAFNAGTATLTINKGITGTGDLTIRPGASNNGRSNWYLLGQSSYSGNTVFSTASISGQSTIQNRIDNALPTGTALFMNGTAPSNNNITYATLTYVLNGFNQTIAGLEGKNGVTGNYTYENTVVGGNASLSTLTVNATADFTFNGTLGGNGSVSGNATDDNNLALVKSGPGILSLGGNNTYTGNTTVNNGTLRVNGNHTAATGNVTVASGAALGGTGTVGGNTTIQANGGLAFDISTDPGSHDKLDLTGSLAFVGASNLTITTTGNAATTGNYTLVTAAGGITGSAPASLNLPSGWSASASHDGTNLILNVTSLSGGPSANVTFTAASQSVAETAGTAILTVQATGTPTGTITANVTFDSGNSTASAGDIGSYTTQTVTLNAGNSYTANVTVTVTDDAAPEANETAVFALTDLTGSAVLASPSTHSLTILANDSFNTWAASYGVNASLTANNDSDKFTNGEEYAFDLDPTVAEYGNVLASTTSLSGGNVTMTLAFNGNSSKQDINYVVRRANNPGFTSNTVVGHWNGTNNWTTSNSTYFGNETQTGAGAVKAINVNMSIPAATEPRQFLKVNIE